MLNGGEALYPNQGPTGPSQREIQLEKTVCFCPLPANVKEQELLVFCSAFGVVKDQRIAVNAQDERFALVEFAEKEIAETCLGVGTHTMYDATVGVEKAKDTVRHILGDEAIAIPKMDPASLKDNKKMSAVLVY